MLSRFLADRIYLPPTLAYKPAKSTSTEKTSTVDAHCVVGHS